MASRVREREKGQKKVLRVVIVGELLSRSDNWCLTPSFHEHSFSVVLWKRLRVGILDIIVKDDRYRREALDGKAVTQWWYAILCSWMHQVLPYRVLDDRGIPSTEKLSLGGIAT